MAIIVSLCLIVLGIAVLLYPSFSNVLYRQKAKTINDAFEQRTEQYTPEQQDELYQQIVAYNRKLYETGQKGLVDAFSYEQVDFSLKAFGFEEEMIGYLTIPKLDLELPVYLGASESNLNRSTGHLSQTSLPVGGKNTNAVIAGHRGYAQATMFRDIDKLETGDLIYLTNFRETLVYAVCEIAIILPTDIDRILIQPGRDMMTLITCHPYGHNDQRYVVYAERMEA